MPFATNHRIISFTLYIIGFVGFVMSLKKGYLRRQFGLFGWVHMSLMLIVVSRQVISRTAPRATSDHPQATLSSTTFLKVSSGYGSPPLLSSAMMFLPMSGVSPSAGHLSSSFHRKRLSKVLLVLSSVLCSLVSSGGRCSCGGSI